MTYANLFKLFYVICPIFYENTLREDVSKIYIDKEYQTNWYEEVNYLSQHGIRYSFVKNVDGVTIWKYKKNVELFKNLMNFYENVYSK